MFGGVLYTGYIQDAHMKITQLKSDIDRVETSIREKEMIQGEIDRLEVADAQISEEDREKLQRLVPRREELDLPRFLYDIYNVVVIEGGKEVQGLSATVGTQVIDGYGTAEVSFSVNCSYEEFKEFVSLIEKNEQLFDVTSVNFTAPAVEGGDATYSLAMTAYWIP
jgi:hypothetical protein